MASRSTCRTVYASGNIAGDIYANVTAEGTGRTLATRLYNMTNDPGMKEMLVYLIARDTMHQNQWMAVIEELKAERPQMPVPSSFPQEQENQDFKLCLPGLHGRRRRAATWQVERGPVDRRQVHVQPAADGPAR